MPFCPRKRAIPTDKNGEVDYNVDKIVNTSSDKLMIYSSISLAKFDEVKKFDPDFYTRLSGIRITGPAFQFIACENR